MAANTASAAARRSARCCVLDQLGIVYPAWVAFRRLADPPELDRVGLRRRGSSAGCLVRDLIRACERHCIPRVVAAGGLGHSGAVGTRHVADRSVHTPLAVDQPRLANTVQVRYLGASVAAGGEDPVGIYVLPHRAGLRLNVVAAHRRSSPRRASGTDSQTGEYRNYDDPTCGR